MFIFDFIFRQKFFKIEFNRIVLHNVLFWTKIMKSIVRIKIVISHYDDSPISIFEPKNHQIPNMYQYGLPKICVFDIRMR